MKHRDIQQSCCGLHTGEALAQHPPNWRISLLAWAVLLCGLLVSFSARNYCQGKPAPARTEAEVLVLRPYGFDPPALKLPPRQFLLAVDNRSGFLELDLRLDRVAGARVKEVQMNGHHRQDWHDVFDLTPGDYLLTEAGHPKWTCKITITP